MALRFRVLCLGLILVFMGGLISWTFSSQDDWYNLGFGYLLAILIGFLIMFSGCCVIFTERSAEDVDRFWRRKEL